MQALKCNRCGLFIAIDELLRSREVPEPKDNGWRTFRTDGWQYDLSECYPSNMRSNQKHLCPECVAGLEKFLKNEPVSVIIPASQVRSLKV